MKKILTMDNWIEELEGTPEELAKYDELSRFEEAGSDDLLKHFVVVCGMCGALYGETEAEYLDKLSRHEPCNNCGAKMTAGNRRLAAGCEFKTPKSLKSVKNTNACGSTTACAGTCADCPSNPNYLAPQTYKIFSAVKAGCVKPKTDKQRILQWLETLPDDAVIKGGGDWGNIVFSGAGLTGKACGLYVKDNDGITPLILHREK